MWTGRVLLRVCALHSSPAALGSPSPGRGRIGAQRREDSPGAKGRRHRRACRLGSRTRCSCLSSGSIRGWSVAQGRTRQRGCDQRLGAALAASLVVLRSACTRCRQGSSWGSLWPPTGQANSQQEGGSAVRGLGAPKVLPKRQDTQPWTPTLGWGCSSRKQSPREGGGPSAWRGTGGRVCVRTPCQGSSAGPCAAGITLKGTAFLRSEAGCGRVLRSLRWAGQRGGAGGAGEAELTLRGSRLRFLEFVLSPDGAFPVVRAVLHSGWDVNSQCCMAKASLKQGDSVLIGDASNPIK